MGRSFPSVPPDRRQASEDKPQTEKEGKGGACVNANSAVANTSSILRSALLNRSVLFLQGEAWDSDGG